MSSVSDAWYACHGAENDVAVSSRVRLARNLANFVFASQLRPEDAERVQSLVFDVFSRVQNPDHYQTIQLKHLDDIGQRILNERGVFSPDMYALEHSGGAVRTDGRISCTINVHDHVRIASFEAGLSVENCFELCRTLDEEMQDYLQFAASAEKGYLTESLFDTGNGMKASVLLHLPSLAYSGCAEQQVTQYLKKGCKIQSCFGSGVSGGVPLGSCYVLWNNGASFTNEQEQLKTLEEVARNFILAERGMTLDYTTNRMTILKDFVYRAVAAVKYGRLIECREGIDLLSKIKWGVSAGILEGIGHTELSALLYRIQPGHMSYVLRSGNFNFERDIATDETKIERLRALIIQDALDDVKILV